MTSDLLQSTSRVVMLKMFLTSDHVSPATGKTVAVTISKNGGAFANPNAGATNATEVSNGWYKVTLDATDTNTVGDLVVRGTEAACDDGEQVRNVIAPHATAAALTTAQNDLDLLTGADGATLATSQPNYAPATAAALQTVDDEIAALDIVADAIKERTDNLPTDPADASVVAGLIASVQAVVDLIKLSTDPLPSDPADQSLIIAATNSLASAIAALNDLSAGAVAAAIWDALVADHADVGSTGAALAASGGSGDPWATALPGAYGAGTAGKIIGDNIDDAITSRMASYVQPPGFLAASFPSDPADQSLVIAATDAIVAAIAALNNLSEANVRTALGMAGSDLDDQLAALPTGAENAAALLDLAAGVETGLTVRQFHRLVAAVLLGKASGLGTAEAKFRDFGDTKDRITATVDENGNRSSVVRDST